MYTISNGPSKIVAKTRRGLHQNYQKFEKVNDNNKRTLAVNGPKPSNNPRPTFQPIRKLSYHCAKVEESVITPHHEELIRYVSDSWNMVLASNPYDTSPKLPNGVNGNKSSAKSSNETYKNNAAYPATNTNLNTNRKVHTTTTTTTATDTLAPAATVIDTNGNAETELANNEWPTTSNLPMSAPFVYNEPAAHTLTDFKPFDLEAWWGRRLFNNITQGT